MPKSSEFTCTVCWHVAESLRALERHWAVHLTHLSGRNDRGLYGCEMCGREFSGLNSLRKHVPIHTRRVQHRCDLCGHVFGKREYLLDHVRSHTGEIR